MPSTRRPTTGTTRRRKAPTAGNPLAELGRSHAEAAFKILADIAKDGESESARLSAANAILDRVFGRPKQAQDLGGAEEPPVKVVIEGADKKLL
jgi:hypothetical protein